MADDEERAKPGGVQDDAKRGGSSARSEWGEFLAFMRENKKWWLIPVVVSLVLLVGLAVVSTTTAAPFVYTLF